MKENRSCIPMSKNINSHTTKAKSGHQQVRKDQRRHKKRPVPRSCSLIGAKDKDFIESCCKNLEPDVANIYFEKIVNRAVVENDPDLEYVSSSTGEYFRMPSGVYNQLKHEILG